MDLAKAKSIMIIILAAFNIFLLSVNLSYSGEQGIQPDTIRNAVSILNARGVKLECDIPENPGRTSKLIYGAGTLDKHTIVKAFLGEDYSEPGDKNVFKYDDKMLVFSGGTKFAFYDESPDSKVNMAKTDEAVKYARNYIKNKGLLKGKYILDEVLSNKDGSLTFKFIEKYQDFLIFDNYIVVTLSDRGIMEIEYEKLEVLGFSMAAAKDLSAAYQVLLAYFRRGAAENGSGGNEAIAYSDSNSFVGSGTGEKSRGIDVSTANFASAAGSGGFGQDSVVITQIDIGYKFAPDQSINGMESTELLPVWRIKLKGISDPLYLNTYDSSHF